jgi:TolA-binding protein
LYLTQGRIAEAKKTLAISAKTTGPLSEDAYFRLIELEQQQGADNEARKLAAEYLRRYPEGRHRAFMESLIK